MSERVRHSPGARAVVAGIAMLAASSLGCGTRSSAARQPPTTLLRIGVSLGIASASNPLQGVSQIIQNVTAESLARLAPDGRMEPQLADSWSLSSDGRLLRVVLKEHVRFADGSPVDAGRLAAGIPSSIRDFMGASMAEGIQARSADPRTLELELPYNSRLWIDALEVAIRKPGAASVATGPFSQDPQASTRLVANRDYYLGRPSIDVIEIRSFPSVRAAWAELLRNNIDMLYEVGTDALDSLQGSTSVSVFSFVRPYQYNVSFNLASGPMRSRIVRQAVNYAIDREHLVQVALNGHGVVSSGPLRQGPTAAVSARGFGYDPQRAARLLNGQHVRFTCLLLTDPIYERIALEVKRQLAAVGVEMELKSVSPDELFAAERTRSYDAALLETISGPSLLRLYLVWHTRGAANTAGRGTPGVDAALDEVRIAPDDRHYQQAISDVQRAFMDDPPAALLAWSERARAISSRFVVPAPEPGRDVIGTMYEWKLRNDQRLANRN